MGGYSIKVVRSKTAIVPVNASLLPRTEEEHERCKRTVYVTNIDLGVEVRRRSTARRVAGACVRARAAPDAATPGSRRRCAASSRRCAAR